MNYKFITYFLLITLYSSLITAEQYPPTIVITEVLSNAPEFPEKFNEFIELFNATTYPIDLSGYAFTDGDAVDYLVSWDSRNLPKINDPDVITSTTVLQPGAYAVILDADYTSAENTSSYRQPYDFPPGTLILTTQDNDLGEAYGLSTSDPITLYRAGGLKQAYAISTYGTPKKNDNPRYCDDDGLDFIPFNPGSGISAERIHYGAKVLFQSATSYETDWSVDHATNWIASSSIYGSTPGKKNACLEILQEKTYTTTKIVEIANSPFFPYGDVPEQPKVATIKYNIPISGKNISWKLTIKIFDITGQLIKTLKEQDTIAASSGEINWDGRDSNLNIAPTGVYICYLEAVEDISGKIHKAQATIVLARKLD